MPPLSSNDAPISTTVGAAFVPKAFAVVTRRAPAETVVLPAQLALLPDKIKRPLPSLVRFPIPDRVEAKVSEPPVGVPIVASPVEIRSGPLRAKFVVASASTKPDPALRVNPPMPVEMLEPSWMYPEASRVRFVRSEE